MNKKIKVYLQYPWKFPDSPYYKYLIDSPPEGIEFQNIKKQKGVITNKRFFWFSNFLKRNIRKLINNLNIVVPNANLSPEGDYDLIHCAHCLSKNTNKPWVADIESWWSMYLSGEDSKDSGSHLKKILLNENCRKILPWSESTKNDILKVVPFAKDKIEVVYPAVPEVKSFKRKKGKIKIIFISRYFYIKGGLISLEVLSKLTKRYDIEAIVVSPVPSKLKLRFPEITFFDLLPQKELFTLMASSDIFLYPSFFDTFGFSLLESMAFGLPVISIYTNKSRSRKEIIENGKTGLCFDVDRKFKTDSIGKYEREIMGKLIKKTSLLIENPSLRKKMSKNCLKEIKSGKFSIKERNKKLRRIYRDALK